MWMKMLLAHAVKLTETIIKEWRYLESTNQHQSMDMELLQFCSNFAEADSIWQ